MDAADEDAATGVVEVSGDQYLIVQLPKDADPSAGKPVKVRLKVTVASGPWGGDGATAPHNLVVIDSDDTRHSMCVMHELGHLINMCPMSRNRNCPPDFEYTEHPKMYWSNGAHCWSGGTLVSSKGKNGSCIMYHALNTSCSLAFCEHCDPFVKAQKLESFNDLKK